MDELEVLVWDGGMRLLNAKAAVYCHRLAPPRHDDLLKGTHVYYFPKSLENSATSYCTHTEHRPVYVYI